ncbi:hypothetical protein CRG98_017584 [Punica granatum]|uniref:Uncharacterized protein n=1 Tax=Punica granatum TaxID=22663 RepID=A0A2I0K0G3_PUNGR|nr:hypothetical protein CRG98_017584 [Punica granatum]
MRARRRMCDGCAEVACTGTVGCARTTRRDALGRAFRRVRDMPRNVLGHIEGAIGHAGISVGQLRHGRSDRFGLRGRKKSGSLGQGIGPPSLHLRYPDRDGRFTVWTSSVTHVVSLVSRTIEPIRLVPTLRLHACRLGSLHK